MPRALLLIAMIVSSCGDAALRDLREPAPDDSRSDAGTTTDARLGPPYPIVLVHGFFASAKMGPVDYWWRAPDHLAAEGRLVFVADTPPAQTPEVRAVQLAAFVDDVLRRTRARKVNLVGHSMGGLDARALVTLGYGDRIASITSIATPHGGSEVADAILGLLPDVGERTIGRLVDGMTKLVDGREQDAMAAARILSTDGMRAFEARHPDDPRVAYFSIRTRTTTDPLFFVHGEDFCDTYLLATYALLADRGLENDGMVPLRSQARGRVLETIAADHFNAVGQPLGVGLAFDYEGTYRNLARTLSAEGF